MKHFFIQHRWLLLMTGIIWIKQYTAQRLLFDLTAVTWVDELVMLVGTLSSAALLSFITLIFVRKRLLLAFLLSSMASTVLIVAHLMYYRFFHDFITLPVFFQSSNTNSLKYSAFHVLQMPKDLIVLVDTILIGLVMLYHKQEVKVLPFKKSASIMAALLLLCLTFNLTITGNAHDEPDSRLQDRSRVVKNAGMMNFQVLDLATHITQNSKKWMAEPEDWEEVRHSLDEPAPGSEQSKQPTKNQKNIIFISMESMQNFTIGMEYNGKPVTPFLNQFIEESLYFNNFYHQTGQGKTSDSEFVVENSLYPLSKGAVFYTHPDNVYQTLTQRLNDENYTTAVMHANQGEFWNREEMYRAIGYDKFFDIDSFNVREESIEGWGLNDFEFLTQSLEKINGLPQPFSAKLITLSNHYPFDLSDYEPWIGETPEEENIAKRYLATIKYMDAALEQFFNQAKSKPWYNNTVFILYGDHYGISPEYYDQLAPLLDKEEISPVDHVMLQKVPLLIHIPGEEGRTDSRLAAQIDLKPTLLDLLNIEQEQSFSLGSSLLQNHKASWVALRDGSVVTEDHVYTHETCYDRRSEEAIQDEKVCDPERTKAHQELMASDEIIYGDLLRFDR